MRDDPLARYARWDRATERPMAIIALLFLGVYAYVVIGNLRLSGVDWPRAFMTGVWVIFALHYVISLVLVRDRVRWFFTHLHELAMALLPFLRPLQLLRLVKLLSVLHKTAGTALRGQVTVYVAGTSAILVLIAALGVLDAEQNAQGANITSFGDAMWWAFVTITTVGYGDYYPVTDLGRMIAVGLMIAGIALIGSVTATLASWFVEKVAQTQQETQAEADAGGAQPDQATQPATG
ncbi:potassium channel family protein [Nesterenkonia sp. AN1]|uniref:potassium channel family protein n=1 Tax=Nesterenkonia sp. AN1 TaxID=652017 RepID=UPI0004B795B1|nr:potassium channel family protein [Nesterenkonia sp. AN1]